MDADHRNGVRALAHDAPVARWVSSLVGAYRLRPAVSGAVLWRGEPSLPSLPRTEVPDAEHTTRPTSQLPHIPSAKRPARRRKPRSPRQLPTQAQMDALANLPTACCRRAVED